MVPYYFASLKSVSLPSALGTPYAYLRGCSKHPLSGVHKFTVTLLVWVVTFDTVTFWLPVSLLTFVVVFLKCFHIAIAKEPALIVIVCPTVVSQECLRITVPEALGRSLNLAIEIPPVVRIDALTVSVP